MKRTLLLLFLLFPLLLAAQEGTWSGTLQVQGSKLRLVFHLQPTAEGWQATMDSPDQGVRGIPIDSLQVSAMGVTLQVTPLKARFEGAMLSSELLMGTFSQQGFQAPLMLKRGEPERPRRPQEPQKPYPYAEQELTFASREAGITLSGTLTIPEGAGPHPAVILVTGSGTQNRDEEIMGHKPFLVLSDRLTRAGYVVFRYDDRGYGASKEEAAQWAHTTTHHLMLDALGAFDALQHHPKVDPARIVIGGHSEGGTIAVMAATTEPRVAGVVSLAGMMTSGAELLATQNRALMLAQGLPTEVVEGYVRALERLYATWQKESPEAVTADMDRLVAEITVGEPLPTPLVENLKQVAAGAQNPWLYYFVRLDPLAHIEQLGERPLWAANGTKDLQVDAEQNLGRLEKLGRSSVVTRRFEGLNHLFQPCERGVVAEYGQIEITCSEEMMQALIGWLDQTFSVAR